MEWFEIEIAAAPSLADALSSFLFDQGAIGMSEGGTDATPILKAYFEKSHSARVTAALEIFCNSLHELFPGTPMSKVSYGEIKDTGWSEKYKEGYKAQKLSHEFFLLPAWDKTTKVPAEMYAIILEPGQAFGTGLHPSTKLSMRLLEYVFQKAFDPDKLEIIDVGTGTGILAIAARKLGAMKVTGIDTDPVAIETALANCELNDCKEIVLTTKPLEEFTKPFDLVVSNILLEAHTHLATIYRRLTKEGGYLIVSGLLGFQRTETIELFESNGFGLIVASGFQEWGAYLFARKGNS